MVTLITSVLVSVLTSFFAPVIGGSTDVTVEGSDRFGLIIDDPSDMQNEETQVSHWQYCP